MFRVAVITLFPEMFSALTKSGVTGRALNRGLAEIRCFNPRDFAKDKHKTVDDRPYGGGPGMVMKIEPLKLALEDAKKWLCVPTEGVLERSEDFSAASGETAKVVYLSPQGRLFSRKYAEGFSRSQSLILIAGRYEGVDERFINSEVDEEISIGDYVLSGGELPAMVVLDAAIRRLPGALGDEQSARQDSFENGLLDCPHYTRPEVLNGQTVPQVLISGDHKKIHDWRLKQALGRTSERRPDLMRNIELTDAQKALLDEYRLERK